MHFFKPSVETLEDRCLLNADIGAIINADLAGKPPGSVVYEHGGGDVRTPVIVPSGVTLHLSGGSDSPYVSDTPDGAIPWTLQDGIYNPFTYRRPPLWYPTQIVGDGTNRTVITEASGNNMFTIEDYNSAVGSAQAIGGKNIALSGFELLGVSPHATSAATSTIFFGNVTNVNVNNVWINSTHCIGLSFGGYSQLDDGTLTNYHANYCTVENCRFTSVWQVNLAVIDGSNIQFTNNRFEGPITGGGTAFLDLEVNYATDWLQNITISSNTFDSTNESNYIWAISITPGTVSSGIVISNNAFVDPGNLMVIAVQAGNVPDIQITGNTITGYIDQVSFVLVNCDYATISGNSNVSGDWGPAIILDSCHYCTIENNTFVPAGVPVDLMNGGFNSSIMEDRYPPISPLTPCDYNIYSNNVGAVYSLVGPHDTVS